jgi:hypothetical protein
VTRPIRRRPACEIRDAAASLTRQPRDRSGDGDRRLYCAQLGLPVSLARSRLSLVELRPGAHRRRSHLLLVPPPQSSLSLLVGGAYQPPLLAALQSLDGAAADLDRRDFRMAAVAVAGVRRIPAGAHRLRQGREPRLSILDPHRDYAGIFIIWDRLFGTFIGERPSDPCRSGIVRNIGSFNPLRIALHEWEAIGRDLRAAKSWRERLVYLLGAPGRCFDGSRRTTDELRAAWLAQQAQ